MEYIGTQYSVGNHKSKIQWYWALTMVDLIVKHSSLVGICLSPTYNYNTTFREATSFPYLKKEADATSETLCVDHMSNIDKVQQINSKLQPTRCNVSWFIYFYRRSTCFRRFLRPSSGAHKCTCSFMYCQPILLLAATMEEMELVPSPPW